MNQPDAISYCGYEHWTLENITSNLQHTYTGITAEDCQPIYEHFRGNFYGELRPSIQVWKRTKLFSDDSEIHLETPPELNNTACSVGIDLPVWLINPDTFNGQFFMLIAEDPLRTRDYVAINELGQLVLSTPFGTHLPELRKGARSLMWKIIYAILCEGYGVYLTDLNKLWIGPNMPTKQSAKFDKNTRKVRMSAALEEAFRKTLLHEIDLVRPKKILSFGKKAKAGIEAMGVKGFHEFPHSAARSKNWQPFLKQGESANHKNVSHAVVEKLRYEYHWHPPNNLINLNHKTCPNNQVKL